MYAQYTWMIDAFGNDLIRSSWTSRLIAISPNSTFFKEESLYFLKILVSDKLLHILLLRNTHVTWK